MAAATAGVFGMLTTRHGTWSPLLWTVVLLFALAVAWGIRRAGRKDAPTGKEAGTPFVSAMGTLIPPVFPFMSNT